jgi:hypothetical protein
MDRCVPTEVPCVGAGAEVDEASYLPYIAFDGRGYEGVSIEFLEGALNPEQYRIRFSKREASNT